MCFTYAKTLKRSCLGSQPGVFAQIITAPGHLLDKEKIRGILLVLFFFLFHIINMVTNQVET